LISAKAKRYPLIVSAEEMAVTHMQFRVPPRKVRRLPHTPGTALVSGEDLPNRSGLYSPASGPQIAVE